MTVRKGFPLRLLFESVDTSWPPHRLQGIEQDSTGRLFTIVPLSTGTLTFSSDSIQAQQYMCTLRPTQVRYVYPTSCRRRFSAYPTLALSLDGACHAIYGIIAVRGSIPIAHSTLTIGHHIVSPSPASALLDRSVPGISHQPIRGFSQ